MRPIPTCREWLTVGLFALLAIAGADAQQQQQQQSSTTTPAHAKRLICHKYDAACLTCEAAGRKSINCLTCKDGAEPGLNGKCYCLAGYGAYGTPNTIRVTLTHKDSKSKTTACSPCAVGYYTAQPMLVRSARCKKCPTGFDRAASSLGDTTCYVPRGYWYDATAKQIKKCVGKVFLSLHSGDTSDRGVLALTSIAITSNHILLPTNTAPFYCPGGDFTDPLVLAPQACPMGINGAPNSGTTVVEAFTRAQCIKQGGYYFNGANIVICLPQYYCPMGSIELPDGGKNQCPPGTFSPRGATSENDCKSGYFATFSTTWLPSPLPSPAPLQGTVDLQNGWTTRDSFNTFSSVCRWDEQVVEVNSAKVFRMSNAFTSTTYSCQVFSAVSGQVAGESNAALWNDYGTNGASPKNPIGFGANAATKTFYSKIVFRSATGRAQPGLVVQLLSSAKQSTVTMSSLRIRDTGADGFELSFLDTRATDGVVEFKRTFIGPLLSYSDLHTIEIDITFVDGVTTVGNELYGNDVVRVWLNGNLIHTGTTWEAYYYYTERITSADPRLQAVNSVQFRLSTPNANGVLPPALNLPGVSGAGLYFEDFAIGNTIPAV